jgi:hypothetical protein
VERRVDEPGCAASYRPDGALARKKADDVAVGRVGVGLLLAGIEYARLLSRIGVEPLKESHFD